ncbi:regucalcin-like [Argonauta hians]
MAVSVVLKNVCSTTGEGPHWEENSQSLLFVDIQSGGISKWNSGDNSHTKIKADGNISFIIPRQSGGYVVSQDTKLADFDWESGQVEPFLTVESDKDDNRFNDAKCDSNGRLWAGTMEEFKGSMELVGAGHLYRVDPDRSLHTIKDKINISNGMAWTSDNATMFYTHTLPRKVYSYDYDINTGDISREQVVVDFEGKELREFGLPDGMTIDANNKIWLACFFSSQIFQIDPETGKTLQSIKFPASQVTSCCFGGKNLDELYVTSSAFGLNEEQLKNEEEFAGSLFKVTGLGAKGLPGAVFKG